MYIGQTQSFLVHPSTPSCGQWKLCQGLRKPAQPLHALTKNQNWITYRALEGNPESLSKCRSRVQESRVRRLLLVPSWTLSCGRGALTFQFPAQALESARSRLGFDAVVVLVKVLTSLNQVPHLKSGDKSNAYFTAFLRKYYEIIHNQQSVSNTLQMYSSVADILIVAVIISFIMGYYFLPSLPSGWLHT